VTKDVSQIRDVTIYGRPMFDSSMNVDMEESTLQFINFSSITVIQRAHSLNLYLLGDPLTLLLM